jgi:hypothetical protein
MYLLRNNKLIEIDISEEDKYKQIRAKKKNCSILYIRKEFNRFYFIAKNTMIEPILHGNETIGDAISHALSLGYRVYNGDVEITL